MSIGGCRVSFVACGLLVAGQLPDPAGLGELGGPGHVHAQQVHAGVLRGEPADELVALAVGVAGQQVADDRVAAGRLLVAVGDDLVEAGAARAAVQVDDDALAARSSRPRARSPAPPRRAARPTADGRRRASPLSLNPHRPSVQVKRLRSGAAHSRNGHSARTCGRGRDRTSRPSDHVFFTLRTGHRQVGRGRRYQTRPRCARVASISSRWTGSSGGRPDQGISSAVQHAQRVSS